MNSLKVSACFVAFEKVSSRTYNGLKTISYDTIKLRSHNCWLVEGEESAGLPSHGRGARGGDSVAGVDQGATRQTRRLPSQTALPLHFRPHHSHHPQRSVYLHALRLIW